MLELQKLRKDINWLIEQIKCLMNKSDLTTALSATEWSTNHTVALGNPYIIDSFVWLNGHIYKSLIDNNEYPPTNATYWTDLGEGHLLLEEQSDWEATTGRSFIRNKPVFLGEAPDDGSQYVRKNESWDKLTTYSAVDPISTNNVAGGYPLGSDWYNTVTGEKFYQKGNGIWIGYTSGTSPVDGSDSPVMFADYATNERLYTIYNEDPSGDQLISTGTGVLFVDGVAMQVGDTILVKNQPTYDPVDEINLTYQNGVYIVTDIGSESTSYILTRADYADETSELYPSQVNILKGTSENRFFLQKTVDPVIGISDIIYEINYVPATQTVVLPVIHMDTATTEPLPSCTYEDIFAPPIGGIFLTSPSTSYLTATVNGPLGVINGVNMSISFLGNRNRKILIKNQVDPIQNGDYEVIQIGSSVQPWKLRRITTTYSSFDKNVREWKINNEASTLYGNRYYMNYTPGFVGTIGTDSITFSELQAVIPSSLQDVTDIGAITTNTITVGDVAGNFSQVLDGAVGSQNAVTGTYAYLDASGFLGLHNGDFESDLKNTNVTNAGVVLEFPDKPTGSYTIATTADVPPTPSLQDVTTVGNITTAEIISESGLIINSADIPDSAAYLAKLGIFSILQSGTLRYGGSFELRETSADGSGNVALVLPSVLTADRLLYLPNKDGVLAVTTDLDTKADLVAGKVPASQLPSYVDDVIEGYYSAPTFYSNVGLTTPIVPETGKIYVDLLANKSYRWSGSVYIQISNPISSINELTDVTVTSPLNGQLLQYNLTTNQWENQTIVVGTGDMQTSTYDIDNDGIVDFAETVPVTVRNPSVSTILRKGTIVYLNGSTGYRPNAYKAQANAEATSSGTFGVVLADIATNSDGTIATLGTVHTLDTRTAANGAPYPFTNDVLVDGDILWLDPANAGYVTKTKPQAPNHAVFIGVVARTHPSLGRIVYRITNGYELDELHNVFINGTLADKHTLYYDAATSLWKTNTIEGILGFNPAQLLTAVTVDSYIGSRLKPADANSNGFHFRKSINGSIGYVAYNSNTGNGAVATNGVGIDSTDDYTNNTYIAHFGTGYYVTQLAGQGALISTKTLFVGAVGVGDINFVTGSDYSTISSKFKILSNGQLQIGVTPATGSTSDFVLVRDSSGNVKQVAYPTVGVPMTRQEFTFTGSQSFTLSGTPSYIYGVFVQGQELDSDQYSSSGTTLTILNTLGASDSVNILYTPTTAGVLEYYTKAEVDALLPTAYTPDINMINATKITLMYNT